MTTHMNTLTDKALLKLMAWLSPSFPVGAYAYSHGCEFAVESGQICDYASAQSWTAFILEFGSARIDADLFIAAHTAAEQNDIEQFCLIAAQADALKGTSELGLESRAQGQAFLDGISKAWPNENLELFSKSLKESDIQPSYAVAVAIAAAFSHIPLQPALGAYLHAFGANIVSAIVRLVPLGQTDGQKIIASLEPVIERSLAASLSRSSGDLGSAAFGVDLMSMKHETQYSRLFRS